MKAKNLKNLICHSVAGAALAMLCSCGEKPESTDAAAAISAEEAKTIAQEAYVYGFPMVMNYKTLYNYVIDKDGPEHKGPFNQLACTARLFTPEDKAIVTPNADTPYCMFWIDLRTEPMVLSVPEMEAERFYHFQLIDLYTHNFAYVGSLTTGNGPGKFLIVGPDWDGEKPDGITEVIQSETNFAFNVTRTQLFGPEDLPKVKQIQGSYGPQPLSAFLGTVAPPTKPLPEFPKWVEGSQFDERFFGYLDLMMDLLEKPGEGESALWEDLARLGIGTDDDFKFASLPAEIQDALMAGVKEGFGGIEKFIGEHSSDLEQPGGQSLHPRPLQTEGRNDAGTDDDPVGLRPDRAPCPPGRLSRHRHGRRQANEREKRLRPPHDEGRNAARAGLLVGDSLRLRKRLLHPEREQEVQRRRERGLQARREGRDRDPYRGRATGRCPGRELAADQPRRGGPRRHYAHLSPRPGSDEILEDPEGGAGEVIPSIGEDALTGWLLNLKFNN